jgi:hypothetical protein
MLALWPTVESVEQQSEPARLVTKASTWMAIPARPALPAVTAVFPIKNVMPASTAIPQ